MRNGRAVGPDRIPVEVWKVLHEEGVDFLLQLFRTAPTFCTEYGSNGMEWN